MTKTTTKAALKAALPTGFKTTAKAPMTTPTPQAPPKTAYIAEATHDAPEAVCPILATILSYPRKHNSASEAAFQQWLRVQLKAHGEVTERSEGSVSLTIAPKIAGQRSTTLFSCHTDTIDPLVPDAANPLARKKMTYDAGFGLIALDDTSVGGSLGADDGAGVWLMLQMMAHGVPGTYLFHRGEECGGISAKANAKDHAAWLKTFEVCVAFDRGHNGDVVTHQGGLRCASDKFAAKLCALLNANAMAYAPSTGGTYTDNKDYRHLIAEVVNVSVGYESQHGRGETLDYAHLAALKTAALAIDWDSLPVDRDPLTADPVPAYKPLGYSPGGNKKWGGFAAGGSLWDKDPYERNYNDGWRDDAKDLKAKPAVKSLPIQTARSVIEEALGMSSEDLLWTATEEPETSHELIVALLRECSRLRADVATLEGLAGL